MAENFTDLNSFYTKIDYRFKNENLLKEALTHPSISHRHLIRHYERLEFLGDRVLGLIIADLLYHHYEKDMEGDLAKRLAFLVSKEPLIAIAKQLELDKYVIVGRGVSSYNEERRLSLLADACEAVIAALYLDGGLEIARKFVEKNWSSLLMDMESIPKDAKSSLQEWAQGRGKSVPEYTIIAQEGPPHAPVFTIEIRVAGLKPQHAKAGSRRQAEQCAAALVLKELEK